MTTALTVALKPAGSLVKRPLEDGVYVDSESWSDLICGLGQPVENWCEAISQREEGDEDWTEEDDIYQMYTTVSSEDVDREKTELMVALEADFGQEETYRVASDIRAKRCWREIHSDWQSRRMYRWGVRNLGQQAMAQNHRRHSRIAPILRNEIEAQFELELAMEELLQVIKKIIQDKAA